MVQNEIRGIFAATADAQRLFVERHVDALARVVALTTAALRQRQTLFFFGNGGSAADAQHLAAEFTNRYVRELSLIHI